MFISLNLISRFGSVGPVSAHYWTRKSVAVFGLYVHIVTSAHTTQTILSAVTSEVEAGFLGIGNDLFL
jgi:hypothetical protein